MFVFGTYIYPFIQGVSKMILHLYILVNVADSSIKRITWSEAIIFPQKLN